MSRWKIYNSVIETVVKEGTVTGWANIAKEVFKREGTLYSKADVDLFRTYIKRNFNKEDSLIEETLEKVNLDKGDWSTAWIKEDGISLLVKNPKKGSKSISLETVRKDLIEELITYAPNYKVPTLKPIVGDPHLLTIDIADLHLGKLATLSETGEEYNVNIAMQRCEEAVLELLRKASGFNIKQVLFVIGNDVLHTDNVKRQTTNGTDQDTDGAWYDNYKLARELYVRIIEHLALKFEVHVVHNPSNHDYMSGYMLADSVFAWLHKHPNITWDITIKHRKYFKFGENLIGTSHGDGAKLDNLPLLMAEEAKEDWASTKYRQIFLHHLHHMKKFKFQTGSDFPGVTVEYLRSPSGTDSWHHKNGYQHAPKAIEGFIHSFFNGPVARLTHMFK
jgi:hypothetical protein